MKTDTIAAIATGMSNSGIGIIRISGPNAIDIIDKIFTSKNHKLLKDVKSHTVNYGYIKDEYITIDEVLVIVMKTPKSYTAEDVVEIQCHGGIIVVKKILETVIKYGARTAEPGEFTKRAFLNGRIDLSQAEAVMDIINSKNEYALQSSVNQLKGAVLNSIDSIRTNILDDIAFIEAALDDPEHISLDNFSVVLLKNVNNSINILRGLLESFDNGKLLKEGIKTVILGRPNAGKSSFLNLIVGEDRAIVTDIAGTTRDTLEETVLLNGINLNIVDTAGIRETSDIVEKLGVDKARKFANESDLIIYIVDGSSLLDENDYDIINMIKGKKAIVLLNKTDLDLVISKEMLENITGKVVIEISAKNNVGIDKFEDCISKLFFKGKISFNEEVYITNIRHKEAISEAIDSLVHVLDSINNGMPEDFYSIDLMNAYEVLGTIIGKSVDEDLVNTIFNKFCMGK